ncbi:unnamed protein product [Camellia sinensis]
MAFPHLPLLLLVFLHGFLIRSKPVKCDGMEDILLEDINCHRQSLNLLDLTQNDEATCLAEKIVDKIGKQPCDNTTACTTNPITIPTADSSCYPKLAKKFPRLLKECNINNSTVRDGVILPLCVVEIVTTGLVCTNCTKSQYSKYLSNSNYTGAGINSGDSWTVIVLSTNTTTGSFVSADDLVSNIGLSHYFLLLLLELFLLS